MRNYLALLGLQRNSADETLRNAVAATGGIDPEIQEEATAILAQEVRLEQYRRVHLQYEAMAACLNRIDEQSMNDTHQWRKRVVDFGLD